MNTFYYLDKEDVKEIKTVKDLDFIKKTKHKNAVKLKKDLVVPDGYIIKNNKVEPTEAKKKEIDDLKAEQELEQKIHAELKLIAIASLTAKGEL